VVLTDDTETKDDKGLFGLDKEHLSNVVLMPGLKVDVDGVATTRVELLPRRLLSMATIWKQLKWSKPACIQPHSK